MITKGIKKKDLLQIPHEELANLVLNLSSIVLTQHEEIANLKEF